MPNKPIRQRIVTANERIAAAADALDAALRELHIMPRHAKTIVSKVVEDAIAHLAVTRQDLLELTGLLDEAERKEGRAGAPK